MIGAILSGAASLAGLGMSLAQMQEAKRQKQDALMAASAAANAFKNIREKNAFAAVQVPTMGYDLAQQGIDRAAMYALSAAQGAGVEGVIGAVPGIVSGTAAASLEQQAGLQEAEYNRNLAQAQAEQGIQQRKAAREEDLYNAQLMGAQGAAQQAEINRQNAIKSAVESGAGALGSFGEAIPLYFAQKDAQPVNFQTPIKSSQIDLSPGANMKQVQGLNTQGFMSNNLTWPYAGLNYPTNPYTD